MNDIKFKPIESVENISTVIKNLFDVDLNISGGWGYDNSSAIITEKLDMPIEQFVHMFATMRANIEMNLALDENKRYGGINLTPKSDKKIEINNKTYNVASFTITAINEKKYAKFIKEYKDGYGKERFDLANHFNKRKENTITREVDCWFYSIEESK